MDKNQWNQFKNFVVNGKCDQAPIGFIIDSPWLPGWQKMRTLDYYTSDDLWLKANFDAIHTFPEVWFLPGFWSEYGMCTEPSAFGARIIWEEENLPYVDKILKSIEDEEFLPKPNVKKDGLLPFVINRLKINQKKINEADHEIRFAISRGPLNIATFLMGTTELMLAMIMEPDRTKNLIAKINKFIVSWLRYQKECFPSIEGIFILDDIVGFVDEDSFKTFAKPYLTEVFQAFDADIRFFHNDAQGLVCAPYLKEIGVNLFNFSFEHSITEMRELCGNDVTLLGNIPPRDVLALGSPADVKNAVMEQWNSSKNIKKVIWSCGGGIPQNVSSENIKAFVEAVKSITLT